MNPRIWHSGALRMAKRTENKAGSRDTIDSLVVSDNVEPRAGSCLSPSWISLTILVVEAISALLTQFPHRVTSRCKGLVLALTYRQDTQSMCAVGDIVSILDGRLACACTRTSTANVPSWQPVSRIAKKTTDDEGFVGLLHVLVVSSLQATKLTVYSHTWHPSQHRQARTRRSWLGCILQAHATRMPHACASPTDG